MLRSDTMAAMSVGPRERAGCDWLTALRDDGAVGTAARQELRRFLVTGLTRALSSRGIDAHACEDFAQDALVRIEKTIDSFREQSRFTTWALSIAIRIAFDELRHKRWKDVSFDAITADPTSKLEFATTTSSSPDKQLVRKQVLAALREVIETKLTEKQRTVLIAELSGVPHARIAQELGMTRNALYKLAHDARKRIKHQLSVTWPSDHDVLWAFE
jgi:RNA polymerase sigma-70 factor (ECF subfamily)